MHLNFPARVIVGLLVKSALILTTLSVLGQVTKFLLEHPRLRSAARFLDLNRERNLPTWYQGLTLLLCATLLWGIAEARRRAAAPYVGHWRGLAAIFAYLFCDEVFKWHERTVDPLRAWLKVDGFLLYAWVIPAMLTLAALAMAYWRFLLSLPRATRRACFLAASLFVGGAVGMEMISGKVHTTVGYGTPAYAVISHVEEILEMSGIIVFVHALLTYARLHLPKPIRYFDRTVTFDDPPRTGPDPDPSPEIKPDRGQANDSRNVTGEQGVSP